MKKAIIVLVLLLTFCSTYVYADPWGSKSLDEALQYAFVTWITDAYAIIATLLILFARSRSTKNILLVLSLFWYLAFLYYTGRYYHSNPDMLQEREREFGKGVYVWRNYYGIILIGMVVTVVYSVYYLYSGLKSKRQQLPGKHAELPDKG